MGDDLRVIDNNGYGKYFRVVDNVNPKSASVRQVDKVSHGCWDNTTWETIA
jgi:hypothetical protein